MAARKPPRPQPAAPAGEAPPADRPDASPAGSARRLGFLWLLAPVLLAALFLHPYVFAGRTLTPWTQHAADLWSEFYQLKTPLLDSLQQYYPRRVYFQEALRGGWLPFWNPNVYGGSPYHAAQQGAVLYPPAWLLALLPAELQFGWSALLHLSLAGIGGFLFLRRLGLSAPAALTGGVAFAFNGFVVVWLAYPNVTQWTLCWLPLALYCWERGREADDLRWIGATAAVLGVSILGGHGQSSAYLLLAWGAWALYRSAAEPEPWRKVARWVALPGALAIALALGQLLPAIDYLPRTSRAGRMPWEDVVRAGNPLSQLWMWLFPRLFGDGTFDTAYRFWLPAMGKSEQPFLERSFYPGAAVLALAAGAVAAYRSGSTAQGLFRFSAALVVLAVLLAMATPLYWPLWRLVPGFGQFTAVWRIQCLAVWGLAVLAAMGVSALTAADPAIRAAACRCVWGGCGVLAAAALIGYYLFLNAVPEQVGRLLERNGTAPVATLLSQDLLATLAWLSLPAIVAAICLPRGDRAPSPALLAAAGVALAGAVFADLFWFGAGFNPSGDPVYLNRSTPELAYLKAQPEPFRFLSAGDRGREMPMSQRMLSNLPSTYGLADIDGSDSFVPRRYQQWREAQARMTGASPWAVAAAPNLRSAGVRYYMTGAGRLFEGLEPAVGTVLQQDRGALPYARLHPIVNALPDSAAVLAALSDPKRPAKVPLMEGMAPRPGGSGPLVPFQFRRLNGNRAVAEGEATTDGLLVIAEGYDPGWRATVDGAPAQVLPVDHWMLGVPLPAGRRHVELRYLPEPYRVGTFGSLAALALLCGLVVAARPLRRGSG
jgi:hypothetical protein